MQCRRWQALRVAPIGHGSATVVGRPIPSGLASPDGERDSSGERAITNVMQVRPPSVPSGTAGSNLFGRSPFGGLGRL